MQHRLGKTLVRKRQHDDGGDLNFFEELFAAMTARTKAPLKRRLYGRVTFTASNVEKSVARIFEQATDAATPLPYGVGRL